MKIDDLLLLDSSSGSPLEQELLDALAAFGFVRVGIMSLHASMLYYCYVTAMRPDGTGEAWQGSSADPEEAQHNALVAVKDWILNQPIPSP
jgi:hypothetical protein